MKRFFFCSWTEELQKASVEAPEGLDLICDKDLLDPNPIRAEG
jgi:hypothetical protein